MKHKIIDLETGKETIRDYTAEEIAQFEKDRAETEAIVSQQLAVEQSKNAARQAVLDKLGLTAEEAAALLA